ncbi:MAG: site-specific integrase [Candidatus Omnitrophota bacterium]|nr:site-specific integrase [Candidatus Omnitrophota bacterium]
MKKWILTPEKYLKEHEIKTLRLLLEEKAIVAETKKQKNPIRDWAIIDIALSAGLRASEICNLRTKDIHIRKGENSIFVEQGKGNKSRLVFIGEKLKKHLKEYLAWKKRVGESTNSEDYLFTSERSPKMSLSAIQKRFKYWVGVAGLKSGYSIHSARHTYGTMLYRNTKDLRMVQKQLGHSSCQVTEVYADVINEDTEKAVNSLYESISTKSCCK